jgi:hypothetical protein
MNDHDQPHPAAQPPERSQPAEIHREREVIVTGDSGRGSGLATSVVVIFALIALAVLAVLAFTFLERNGDGIIPDELDITVELPTEGSGS